MVKVLIKKLDPAVENSYSLQGKPFQVFPQQDQEAHIRAHRAFMSSVLVKSNPAVMSLLQGHITIWRSITSRSSSTD